MCGIQGEKGKGGRGDVVHADMFRELIAAIVELGGGETGSRSTWYRG
jgi:hypothetical protein